MTGPKGNSEFCFPENLNIDVEGKQNSLFPAGPVINCFVIPPNSKTKQKKMRRNRLLDAGWLINLPWFQGTRPDHVQVESSGYCFLRELMSFDPRGTFSFNRYKHIWVGRYDNFVSPALSFIVRETKCSQGKLPRTRTGSQFDFIKT